MIAHIEYDLGAFRPPLEPWVLDIRYVSNTTESYQVVPKSIDVFARAVAPRDQTTQPVPVFTWAHPDVPAEFDYSYFITVHEGSRLVWSSTAIPSDQTSGTYGADGEPLKSGYSYNWRIVLRDTDGNTTEDEAAFTVQ